MAEVSCAETARAESAGALTVRALSAAPARPALSAQAAAMVQARLRGAVPEMIEAIAREVSQDASRERADYQRRVTDLVTGAVEAIFAYLDELAATGAEGYPDAYSQAVEDRQGRLQRRQIHELFGDQLRDPDLRFELQVALRIRKLTGSTVTAAGTPVRADMGAPPASDSP